MTVRYPADHISDKLSTGHYVLDTDVGVTSTTRSTVAGYVRVVTISNSLTLANIIFIFLMGPSGNYRGWEF